MMILEDHTVKTLLSTWGLPPKPCDSCKTSPALLFCRPHSAFLCIACDASIHHPLLPSRHARVSICEVCEQFPADVTCKADAAALCSSCDRHIHSANPLAARHQRLPVLPFFETPSALSAVQPPASIFPVDSAALASPTDDNWPIPIPHTGTDFLQSDTSSFLDFGTPNNIADRKNQTPRTRSYVADSDVPIQTKSISYLDSYAGESCFRIDFSQSKLSQYNHSSQSVSSSESGVVPDGISNSMSEVSNSTNSSLSQPLQLSEMDRKARVMRYREKKKNRKFQKTIRYASRKAYAERRPRVKGRFAKRMDGEGDGDVGSCEVGLVVDHGVVPLF